MSDGTAYDSLGRIIARGGELSVAWAMTAFGLGERFDKHIADHFPGITPEDKTALVDLVSRAFAAGESLQGMSGDERLPTSAIPQSPTLFGDKPAGRRIRYGVEIEFTDPDSGESYSYMTYVVSGISETHADLVSRIEEAVIPDAQKYIADRLGLDGDGIEPTSYTFKHVFKRH